MKYLTFCLMSGLTLSGLLLSCQSPSDPVEGIGIRGISVIPMHEETILENQDVWITNGIIQELGTNLDFPPGAIIIEGQGKYLIPGLAEMHAHVPDLVMGNDSLIRETLFLYLANGITTIRGMLGRPHHLELLHQVDADLFPSPRLYTSSPSISGATVPTADSARTLVRQYAQDGYHFLKIHPGVLRPVFDVVAATAKEAGTTFAGHVPAEVGIHHALESGYTTIDHIDGYVEGLAPHAVHSPQDFFGILLSEQLDTNLIGGLVDKTSERGVAIVPTQTLMTRWLNPRAQTMLQDPEMVYIPPSMRFSWRQSIQQMQDRLMINPQQYQRYIEIRQRLIKAMQDRGVLLLLGSDAPQVLNVPGFSIHREMASMVDAGLKPYEVLKSGTVNVATFYQAADRGTVAKGKVADLVILGGNPLDNIAHTQKVESVIYRGKLLTRNAIDEGLQAMAAKYGGDD